MPMAPGLALTTILAHVSMAKCVRWSGVSLRRKVAGVPSHEPTNAGAAHRPGVHGAVLVRSAVSGDAFFRPVGSTTAKSERGGQLGAGRRFHRGETGQQCAGAFR